MTRDELNAHIEKFQASGKVIQLVPQGKRNYTPKQMADAVRNPKPRDYLNERHSQRMSDGRVITVNGYGEPC